MILKSFEVEPEVVKFLYNDQVEIVPTDRNKVTIEVECSDKECDELYKQFKGGKSDEQDTHH